MTTATTGSLKDHSAICWSLLYTVQVKRLKKTHVIIVIGNNSVSGGSCSDGSRPAGGAVGAVSLWLEVTVQRVEEPPAPVELVDVLDVPEESAHLLGTDGQVALIDDVSQVVLRGGRNQSLSLCPAGGSLTPLPTVI